MLQHAWLEWVFQLTHHQQWFYICRTTLISPRLKDCTQECVAIDVALLSSNRQHTESIPSLTFHFLPSVGIFDLPAIDPAIVAFSPCLAITPNTTEQSQAQVQSGLEPTGNRRQPVIVIFDC